MFLTYARRAVVVTALFAISGCFAGGSAAPPAGSSLAPNVVHAGVPFATLLGGSARGLVRSIHPNYATNKSLLFESDQTDVAINVYQTADLAKNPSPIASIAVHAGCPYGAAVDKKGTIYVADNCSGNDVEEFAKGSTTLKTAITDGISNPLGAAIDSKGTLYVSNYPGAITEYAFGTTTPSQTISGQGLTDPFGLSVDKSNNLYIADFGANAVFELKYGSTTLTNLGLQDCDEPLGTAVDEKHGNLWVTCGEGDTIEVYKLGSTSPSQTIAGNDFPYAIALENKGKPKDEVVESDIDTHSVYAYAPGTYTPYATLTNGVSTPTGLLITKP
ncbi:MAG TPA: hypothetical protein VGX91_09995 [Candidatus Cybelea sp.]|nr:hypothetical protein [Candidatus Cybelea sp.]